MLCRDTSAFPGSNFKQPKQFQTRWAIALWFETRGFAALITMRTGKPHPEERRLRRVSKDEAAALE
jgi:hypothetical protein